MAQIRYNTGPQLVCNVRLRLIQYTDEHFARLKAKRFLILDSKDRPSGQNLWIPNSYLFPDGTIDPTKDLSWLFNRPENQRKLWLASHAENEEDKT